MDSPTSEDTRMIGVMYACCCWTSRAHPFNGWAMVGSAGHGWLRILQGNPELTIICFKRPFGLENIVGSDPHKYTDCSCNHYFIVVPHDPKASTKHYCVCAKDSQDGPFIRNRGTHIRKAVFQM